MAEEDRKESVLDTPKSILEDAVSRFNRLDVEAQEASSSKDAATCRQKLAERARLIADLPARVRETMIRGQSFPEEGFRQLDDFSELAEKSLKDGGAFALGTLLKPRGSLVSDPNSLEELVNELYPPETDSS
ncbi:MAG TPA: hypothetical protein VMX77_01805 [Candidatus Bathyarchaeia archaeon]|nr:hypothetical protein [Candidatus Bathyarchaeia archaeon]